MAILVALAGGLVLGGGACWAYARARLRALEARAKANGANPAQAPGTALLVEAQRAELQSWLGQLGAQVQGEGADALAGSVTQGAGQAFEAAKEILTISQQVRAHIASLAESIGQTSLAIDEMTFGSVEVASNLEDLSRVCEETASSMIEMNVSIGAVEANANEASRISAQVNADAETGAAALSQTVAGIHRIREGNRLATDVIEDLDQKIFAVGKILGVIDDVAEQTNLLALNAAIIAAQAGEHGRGFAVVADEIKALAERTGASTKEIAELILTMQQQSRRATESMAQGLANVEAGVKLGHNAGEALQKIVASANRSTGMTQSIAQATIEQTQRSTQVTDAISRVAQTVQQIAFATAEQAKGAQHLNQNAGQMRGVVGQVQESTDVQRRTSEQVIEFLQALPGAIERLQHALGRCQEVERALAAQVGAALEALGRDAAPP